MSLSLYDLNNEKAGKDVATVSVNGLMPATDKAKLNGIEAGATVNSNDSTLLARANHTGTQSINTITNLSTELSTRASMDTVLSSNLSTEVSIRTTQSTTTSISLSTEASTRASTDTILSSNLSTEASTRNSIDSAISTALSTEVSQRISTDLILGGGIVGDPTGAVTGITWAPTDDTTGTLTWTNPIDGNFGKVIVMQQTNDYPQSIYDGTQIYSGVGTSTTFPIQAGTATHLRAFVYSKGGILNNSTSMKVLGLYSKITSSNASYALPSVSFSSFDVFLVGGGAGGGSGVSNGYGGGGGGGYTTTSLNIGKALGQTLNISIGIGGTSTLNGGITSLTYNSVAYQANGGIAGTNHPNAYGGNGGSGGGSVFVSTNGTGGTDGGNGASAYGGYGQGITTKAFANSNGIKYAGGGSASVYGGSGDGSGGCYGNGYNGIVNTGGGGAGGQGGGGYTGGSGIVLIRYKM